MIKAGKDAALIVLGPRRLGGFRGLLRQHVLETVLALRNGLQLTHQIDALRHQQMIAQVRPLASDTLQDALPEVSTDHGRCLQRGAGISQPIDPGHEQRMQRVRDLHAIEVGCHPPLAILGN